MDDSGSEVCHAFCQLLMRGCVAVQTNCEVAPAAPSAKKALDQAAAHALNHRLQCLLDLLSSRRLAVAAVRANIENRMLRCLCTLRILPIS